MSTRKPAPRKTKPAPAAKPKRKHVVVDRPSRLRHAFLVAYGKCGIITAAAEAAHCSRTQHYDWLADPEYAKAFENAHAEALERHEAEIYRRGVVGYQEPVIYQGELSVKRDSLGRRTRYPLTIRRFSDNLLMFRTKALAPEKYRENVKHELTGNVSVVIERLEAARKRMQEAPACDGS